MIRKSGYRFSEKIMRTKKIDRDDDSKKSHPDLIEMLPKLSRNTASAAVGDAADGSSASPAQSRCRLRSTAHRADYPAPFSPRLPNPRGGSRRCSHKRPWRSWRRCRRRRVRHPWPGRTDSAPCPRPRGHGPRPGLERCLPYRRQRLRLYRQYPLPSRQFDPCPWRSLLVTRLRNTRLEMILGELTAKARSGSGNASIRLGQRRMRSFDLSENQAAVDHQGLADDI